VGQLYPAIMAQTFYTEPGREYVLSGWVGHNPGLIEGRVDLYLNGELLVQLHHKGYATPTKMLWTRFSQKFRATTDQTTLAIQDVTGLSYTRGAALDGLSVTLGLN
jgi:hypothetical protein